MLNFNDKITLGVFAGIISNIIRNIVGFITYYMRINQYHIWHFAASAYLSQEEIKSFYGMILGMLIDYGMACFLGIFTVYFLSYEGTKNYILKGIVIGTGAWLLVFTLVVRFEISKIAPETVSGCFSFFFNHVFIGILLVIFTKRYGKNILN